MDKIKASTTFYDGEKNADWLIFEFFKGQLASSLFKFVQRKAFILLEKENDHFIRAIKMKHS